MTIALIILWLSRVAGHCAHLLLKASRRILPPLWVLLVSTACRLRARFVHLPEVILIEVESALIPEYHPSLPC